MSQNDGKKFVLPRLLLALMILFLIMYFVSIITGYKPFYESTVEKNAIVDIYKDSEKLSILIEEKYQDLYDVKEKLVDTSSADKITAVLSTYIGSDTFGDLRYFSKGKIYDVNGSEVTSEVEQIKSFIGLERNAFSGEYMDKMVSKSCISFYIPITGSDNIDGLASIIEARNFVDMTTVLNERADVVAIITETGYNLSEKITSKVEYNVGNNYYDFIDRLTQNAVISNDLVLAVKSGDKTVTHVKVNGQNYAVAVSPIDVLDNKLFLVSLSSSQTLIETEMSYFRHAIVLLGVAIISLATSLVYALLYYKTAKRQIRYANYTFPNIDCPNVEQFKLDVINNTNTISIKKYSIVSFKIQGYMSLNKYLGEKQTDELLRQAAKIFDSFCEFDESYAYLGNGIFVMHIKHVDEHSFARKISMIRAISAKNKEAIADGINLKFNVGVCHAFGGTKRSVAEMVENAVTASNIAKDRKNKPFVVYDKDIDEEMARDEKIESMMEEGLKNGDFKLFLQPKYNIKHDRLDSAEALVRWFDHEKADYIFPSEFIGLFETNGFIVKLDHYIYLEVLKYFKRAVERGEKVVPISVNVSRVTASTEGFLDFYAENKNKYGIGDGFIMLEFTETFAADDNKNILKIVEGLHKNGILCSLDDFGSGFSSFNILKNIPFDELKLDRCLIGQGYDKNRDEIVLKSVIDLAKSLGIKVAQEGVETKEMLDKVKEYGCDVAQGYYYAKAISLEEFRVFIDTNTSIVYKSKVK